MKRMDLDIGTLIYILVTVVAVIGGIARKRKKPATGGAPTEEGGSSSSGSGFFGKLEQQLEKFAVDAKGSMEGLTGQTVSSEPEHVEVDERDYFEKLSDDYEAVGKNDFQNSEILESEEISVIEDLESNNIEEDQERSFADINILKDFDARAAVIYSTIINRIEI